MRNMFIFSFVANLILTAATLLLSPARVAIHFGLGGDPNGWAPAYVNALVMSGINTLLFLALFFSPKLIAKMPARWINLPNRDYWLREDNRRVTESLLTEQQYQFGTALFIFLFLIGVLALQANLSTPIRLREDLFLWVFGLFMAYVAYWTVHLMRMFRIPQGARR